MSGTTQGGTKTRETMTKKLGSYDAYIAHQQALGKKGGKAPHSKPRGFAAMSPEKLKQASAKGGSISRIKSKSPTVEQPDYSVEIDTKVFFSKSAKVRAFLRTVSGRA